MHKLLLYIFLIFSFNAKAQSELTQKDTVKISKEIESFIMKSDSIKEVKKFINSKKSNDSTKHYLAYNKIFLQRGINTKNFQHQYYAAYRIGYTYHRMSDYFQSIAYAKLAKTAAVQLNDTLKNIKSTLLYAGNYQALNLYNESLKLYLEIRDLTQRSKTKKYEHIVESSIASVRVLLKNYEEALKNCNTVLKILDKKNSTKTIAYHQTLFSTLLDKGKCQKKLGHLDDALITYQQGIKLAETLKFPYYKIDFLVSLGNTYYLKQDYTKAQHQLKEIKKLIQNKHKDYDTILLNYYLAQCYAIQNKKEEAIRLLTHNFDLTKERLDIDLLKEMYKLRIKIAKEQNDLKTVAKYQNHLNNFIERKSRKQLNTVEMLLKSDIVKYQYINKELELEFSKTNNQKRAAIFIVIILLLFLCFSFIYFKRKNRIKAQQFEEVIKKLKKQKEAIAVNKSKIVIKDTQAKEILENLSILEKKEFFKSKDCNLYTTAKAIQTNTTYLSKVLNKVKKQSFNQYLNDLRINYVLLKLKEDTRFRSYTIKAISEEIGYKSVTTFLRAFKAKTNLNPSYYIEKLNVN